MQGATATAEHSGLGTRLRTLLGTLAVRLMPQRIDMDRFILHDSIAGTQTREHAGQPLAAPGGDSDLAAGFAPRRALDQSVIGLALEEQRFPADPHRAARLGPGPHPPPHGRP